MKKLILLLLLPIICISQNEVLDITVKEENNNLIFIAQNNSDKTIEATLLLKNISGLRGSKNPQQTTLASGESGVITTLTIKGKYSYKYETRFVNVSSNIVENSSNEKAISKIETKAPAKKRIKAIKDKTENTKRKVGLPRNQFLLRDLSQVNKGIVVFDKTDCPRCSRTTAYLYENNIPFKIVDVTRNNKGKELMQTLVREDGNKGKFTTPVILINGKISYSHKNLEAFLTNLK